MNDSPRSQPSPILRPNCFLKLLGRGRSRYSGKLSLMAGLIIHYVFFQAGNTLAQPWNGGTYLPPRNVGFPEQTSSGSSRGNSIYINNPNCPVVGSPLALIPINVFGVTLKSHPTFLFYLPAARVGENSPMLEYSLQDTQGNEIYKTRFVTNGKAGVASLILPQGMGFSGLDLDKDYFWSVSLICQGSDRIRDLVVQGAIRRVPVPTTLVDFDRKTSDQQADLLWQAGIWYDLAALLAELQRPNVANPQANIPPNPQWQALMEAVELNEIINQPFLPNGSIPNSATFLPR